MDNSEIRDLLLKNNAVIESLSTQVIELKAELDTVRHITSVDKWSDFKQVAKALGYKDFGRNTILAHLRERGYLDEENEPYQRYVDAGLFKVVQVPKVICGRDTIMLMPVASQKGIMLVDKIIKEIKNGSIAEIPAE